MMERPQSSSHHARELNPSWSSTRTTFTSEGPARIAPQRPTRRSARPPRFTSRVPPRLAPDLQQPYAFKDQFTLVGLVLRSFREQVTQLEPPPPPRSLIPFRKISRKPSLFNTSAFESSAHESALHQQVRQTQDVRAGSFINPILGIPSAPERGRLLEVARAEEPPYLSTAVYKVPERARIMIVTIKERPHIIFGPRVPKRGRLFEHTRSLERQHLSEAPRLSERRQISEAPRPLERGRLSEARAVQR